MKDIKDLDVNKYLFINSQPSEPVCHYIHHCFKSIIANLDERYDGSLDCNRNPFTDSYQKFYFNLYVERYNKILSFKNTTSDVFHACSIKVDNFELGVRKTLKHKNKYLLDISEKILTDIFRQHPDNHMYPNYKKLYNCGNVYDFRVLEPSESKLGGVKYYYDYKFCSRYGHLSFPKSGYIEIYLNDNNNYDIFIYYLVGHEKGYKLKQALNNIPLELVHSRLNDVLIRYTPKYLKSLKNEKEKELKIQNNAIKKAEKSFKEDKTINDNPYKNDVQKFFWEYRFRELQALKVA